MRLLELLNMETGSSVENISRIIYNAPRRYKVYEIAKRNGGTRTIAHPARELKILQRIILAEILNKAPVSPIAMAYVTGRGILANAVKHAEQRWVLKLDFEQFFFSITPHDWDRTVKRVPELQACAVDRPLFHRLLFWGAGSREPTCLSIGAPTSPSVSNLVCGKLDAWLIDQASRNDLVVTRYADDITVSGANLRQLIKFEAKFRTKIEENRGLNLKLNEEKRGLYGPGERRMVTGLIITPEGKVSIGRQRKREISALVHKCLIGEATGEGLLRTKGLLAFVNAVEPEFLLSMKTKYGGDSIRFLLKSDSVSDYLPLDDEGF